ncbi:hypothetical protein RZS08_36085, partial [Arthrospira platensis SPKY1]|nr:hypothetical protein [Arthrospira platensis SPKY1]
QHGRRATPDVGLQGPHHRLSEHRVTLADDHQRAPLPALPPEQAGLARDGSTLAVGKFGHHLRKGPQRGPVAAIRKRRVVGLALGIAQVGIAALEQARHVEVRLAPA